MYNHFFYKKKRRKTLALQNINNLGKKIKKKPKLQ